MIVWLNGTFGVGKTTTAEALSASTRWRVFDPEHVGYVVSAALRDYDVDDFQDLSPWRALVPKVAAEIYRFTAAETMIAVQSVHNERYWEELTAGLKEQGLPVFHVVLTCETGELRRRIDGDELERNARQWRLDHIEAATRAQAWLLRAADLLLDTTDLSADSAANTIAAAVAAQ